jgi:RND family efflux transporter MFP subunit
MQNGVSGMSDSQQVKRGRRFIFVLVAYILPVLILGGSGVAALIMIKTPPTSSRKSPEARATLVAIQPLMRARERVVVSAMGTVVPSRKVTLLAQVGGRLIELSPEFTVGGVFKGGEEMLRLDPKDYELSVKQKENAVVKGQSNLKIEQGYQEIAAREWELLNAGEKATDLDRELALRKPYLESKMADLATAESDLEQAKLDLSRTVIRSPFNAMVLAKGVDLGTEVSTQTQLATLVGTDVYWVQVSVPMDRLKWLKIPLRTGEVGSPAVIYNGENGSGRKWKGHVIRLLGELETEGRMAQILVEVRDPLGLASGENQSPLLLGSYMKVDIEGSEVADVFSISRSSLRDGQQVWLMGEGGGLTIRDVDVVWRDEEKVLIREGLKEGEELVVSDIASPVAGMALKVDSDRQTAKVKE